MRFYAHHNHQEVQLAHHCHELCTHCQDSSLQSSVKVDHLHPYVIEFVHNDFTIFCGKGSYLSHTTFNFIQEEELIKIVFQIEGQRQVNKLGNRTKKLNATQVFVIHTQPSEGTIECTSSDQFFFELHIKKSLTRQLFPQDFFEGNCVQEEHLFDYFYEPTVLLNATAEHISLINDYWNNYKDNPFLSLDSELIVRQLLKGILLQKASIATCELSKSGYIKHSDKILMAKEVIENNIERPCSLIDLAHQVGTNECTLKKGFKSMTGDTIMSYWTKLRLNKAKEHLTATEESISGIAYGLGYKSPQHFTKAFKKEFGVTPQEFRKEMQF